MKLDAWLRQEHSLADRLLVCERLAQALNEIHDRGEPLAALQPDNVDVAGDGRCDLSGARRGTPAAGYIAPERAEGGPASLEADVYAAGAIAWEVLSGNPCGASPTHLSEARPDLSRDLADAVMACLERSPQWRPRDLTYLAQLAQHAQGAKRAAAAPARSTPRAPARGASSRTRATTVRSGDEGGSATRVRLAIGALLTLAVAGGAAYFWLGRSGERAASAPPPAPTTLAAGTAAATPTPMPAPAATAAAPSVGRTSAPPTAPPATLAAPVAASATVPPPRQATPAPASALPPTAVPVAVPRATPAAQPPQSSTPTAPPRTVVVAPTPAATTSTSPTQAAAASGSGEPAATSAPVPAALPPASLSTVSPLSARRPGKVLLDLRGAGLNDSLRVRVLPMREQPRGISVLRQKRESDTLLKVLLDLDEHVSPGPYAVVLEDAAGHQTNPLTFTVTR